MGIISTTAVPFLSLSLPRRLSSSRRLHRPWPLSLEHVRSTKDTHTDQSLMSDISRLRSYSFEIGFHRFGLLRLLMLFDFDLLSDGTRQFAHDWSLV